MASCWVLPRVPWSCSPDRDQPSAQPIWQRTFEEATSASCGSNFEPARQHMAVGFHNQGFSAINKLFSSETSPNLARKLLLSPSVNLFLAVILFVEDCRFWLCWFTQKKQEVCLNSFIVRAKGSNCKQQLHTFNDSTQYYKCSSKISQSKSFLASRMKGLTHICVQGVNTKMNLL